MGDITNSGTITDSPYTYRVGDVPSGSMWPNWDMPHVHHWEVVAGSVRLGPVEDSLIQSCGCGDVRRVDVPR